MTQVRALSKAAQLVAGAFRELCEDLGWTPPDLKSTSLEPFTLLMEKAHARLHGVGSRVDATILAAGNKAGEQVARQVLSSVRLHNPNFELSKVLQAIPEGCRGATPG